MKILMCFSFICGMALGFTVWAALAYLMMNVLLPFLGIVYPLTWPQCFAVSVALFVIRTFVQSMFGRTG